MHLVLVVAVVSWTDEPRHPVRSSLKRHGSESGLPPRVRPLGDSPPEVISIDSPAASAGGTPSVIACSSGTGVSEVRPVAKRRSTQRMRPSLTTRPRMGLEPELAHPRIGRRTPANPRWWPTTTDAPDPLRGACGARVARQSVRRGSWAGSRVTSMRLSRAPRGWSRRSGTVRLGWSRSKRRSACLDSMIGSLPRARIPRRDATAERGGRSIRR
jgi:hypothetical protein